MKTELANRFTFDGIKPGDYVVTAEIHQVAKVEGKDFLHVNTVLPACQCGAKKCKHLRIMSARFGQQGVMKLKTEDVATLPTIRNIENLMHAEIAALAGAQPIIEECKNCQTGRKIVYGRHTQVEIPASVKVSHQLARAIGAVINHRFDRVTRVVLQKGTVTHGGTGTSYRTIVCHHE